MKWVDKMKKFFAGQSANFVVGIITNLLSAGILSITIISAAQSEWARVKFLGEKPQIACKVSFISNTNLWVYGISLKIPHKNRSEVRSLFMISKNDDFFIEPDSLETPDTFSLGKPLGVEESGAYYGARFIVQKTLDESGSSEIKFKIRSDKLIKEGTCDLFAFSEY